ncbi:group II intron reverse transcriptase/maturase [Spirochaetia bacterium]|nr:group II intron reverse transcriptase/maturase [Spirochaetia bacterium]
MCREQKTANLNSRETGYPREDRVEPEGTCGARSIEVPGIMGGDSVGGRKPDGNLLEQVLSTKNMFDACERVIRNGGAAGVDGMRVEELQPYLIAHYQELSESIRGGWYKPNPVRRVEIPKPDGGKRLLGVPTVIDRMVQQAMVQVLQPIFEQTFSDSSYGFRPGRSAHQAIKRAKGYFEEGYTYVVDLDLEKYFDTVNHDLLIKMVRETVKDEGVITMIKKFLKSGVMVNGLVSQTEQGTPQGGNLSPLLSNIYLTKFDRMLEERGHKFVRYADDCNIYVKSLRAAERVMEGCTKFLEGKLKLKVNRKKSMTGSPTKLKFLGFSFYRFGKRIGIRIHEKSLDRLKERLKALTSRKRSGTIEWILKEITRYLIGWLGYYSIADMKKYLQQTEEWLRRRIRQIFWKRWKRVRTRCENLIQLGTPKDKAWQWANTRKSYWHTAHSWILTTTLNNHYLESIGFPNVAKRYEVLHATH